MMFPSVRSLLSKTQAWRRLSDRSYLILKVVSGVRVLFVSLCFSIFSYSAYSYADTVYYEASGSGKHTTGTSIGTACTSLAGMTGFIYSNFTPYGLYSGSCNGVRRHLGELWVIGNYKRFIDCDVGEFDSKLNKCVSSSDNGQPDASQSCSDEPSTMAGNPINFATGNKYHEENYASTGMRGMSFKRFYNSSDVTWRHSYSDKIVAQADQLTLVMSNGKSLRYNLDGTPKDNASASWGVMTPLGSGWRFMARDRKVYEFDTQGRLSSIRDPSNGLYTFSYTTLANANEVEVAVRDEAGSQFSFKQRLGKLYYLSIPGVEFSFVHGSAGQLVKTIKVINGQQFTRLYHYEDTKGLLNLTGITDERGVRYATWRYDDQWRAISSQHAAGADKILIAYNADGSTTITNELGKKTTYRFQVINGRKHITSIDGEPSANCPNSNSTFTYDTRGLLKTKTDNKGHLTTYDYNARGLEVSRTEAAGTPQARTITTDWHPTLFLPVTVTEPSRITTYTYDDQGRQLSQTQTDR